MAWQQLTLQTTQQHAEAISEQLWGLNALSVTYQDAEDKPIYEPLPGETPLWQQIEVTALFELETDMHYVQSGLNNGPYHADIAAINIEKLDDKEWTRVWMDDFQPMCFAEKFWVCPSWLPVPHPEQPHILLDPGVAFGTGTHETTALCLEWLAQQDCQDKTVIDFGCGSGILAIAALKLGAKHVLAIDIDPQAREATQQNADNNQIKPEQLSILAPEALSKTHADLPQADLMLANILAKTLIELSAQIQAMCAQKSNIVLSGILSDQAAQVESCYTQWFNLQPAVKKQDWVLLSGTKKGGEKSNVCSAHFEG